MTMRAKPIRPMGAKAQQSRDYCVTLFQRPDPETDAYLRWASSYGGPAGAVKHFGGYQAARTAYEAQ
jgi:hypothetical protein